MVDSSEVEKFEFIRRYIVVGSRRFSNFWWASIILLGGSGFLLTGVSSYLQFNLFPFIKSENILFFPQGLVMCFYGVLGVIFSVYLWLTIFWSVGEGFNEFNKKEGIVRIFRWGFPGKNRRIDLCYSISDVEAVRVELKEGINPRRTIFVRVKGKRDIPLTRIGQPMTLDEIEKQGAELAKFLQVPLLETSV
nr:pafII [Streptosarcina sp. YL-2023a]